MTPIQAFNYILNMAQNCPANFREHQQCLEAAKIVGMALVPVPKKEVSKPEIANNAIESTDPLKPTGKSVKVK